VIQELGETLSVVRFDGFFVLVLVFALTKPLTKLSWWFVVPIVLIGLFRIAPLTNKYVATITAVVLGGAIAMLKGPAGMGSGGLLLWPLFGATNQLLAGLAFMVTAFYLWRRNKPVWFVVLPMIFMIVLPGWALVWQLFNPETGWWTEIDPETKSWKKDNLLVAIIGSITLVLQVWMVIEALLIWPKVKGVIEIDLPPLKPSTELESSGGRSC